MPRYHGLHTRQAMKEGPRAYESSRQKASSELLRFYVMRAKKSMAKATIMLLPVAIAR